MRNRAVVSSLLLGLGLQVLSPGLSPVFGLTGTEAAQAHSPMLVPPSAANGYATNVTPEAAVSSLSMEHPAESVPRVMPSAKASFLTGQTKETAKDYTSEQPDVSAILVTHGAVLKLIKPEISVTADASSPEDSLRFGVGAGLLSYNGGMVTIEGGTVQTQGAYSGAAFASGRGSMIVATGVLFSTQGNNAAAVTSNTGGFLTFEKDDLATGGSNAPALLIGEGSGPVTVKASRMQTLGAGSPLILARSTLTGEGLVGEAQNADALVLEGLNAVAFQESVLGGAGRGVVFYDTHENAGLLPPALKAEDKTAEKQGAPSTASFIMSGGALRAHTGPLFYVTNDRVRIILQGVTLQADSGILVQAEAGRWGADGTNGGNVSIEAHEQKLEGAMTADALSQLSLTLKEKSQFTGTITNGAIALDAESSWTMTGNSTVTTLIQLGEPTVNNILSNGHTLRYDASQPENAWLSGNTYPLPGNGFLMPVK